MSKKSAKSEFYLGNPNLPNRHWKEEYTIEMVEALKLCKSDLLYFAENFFFIIDPDNGKLKIKLFPYQKQALTTLLNNNQVILLASRQVGKTTLLTIYALWIACFNEYQNIIIVANKESTAIDIFRRVRLAYEEMPNWAKPGVKEYGKTSLELENGSRIGISTTTGSAARGQSINCITDDTLVTVKNKHTQKIETINISELKNKMHSNNLIQTKLIL